MALRHTRKPGFGAGEGVSLPASFFVKAAALLAEAQLTLERGRAAYVIDPVGIATLQSAIGLKYKSLDEVHTGTLSPTKWVEGVEGLIWGIDDFFRYQDVSNSLTQNAKTLLAELRRDLVLAVKVVGGAAVGGVGLYLLGVGAVAAYMFFGGRRR